MAIIKAGPDVLDLTEHVTRLEERGVPVEVFTNAQAEFDEVELGQVLAGSDERQLR